LNNLSGVLVAPKKDMHDEKHTGNAFFILPTTKHLEMLALE
jgi:hypothetical protein